MISPSFFKINRKTTFFLRVASGRNKNTNRAAASEHAVSEQESRQQDLSDQFIGLGQCGDALSIVAQPGAFSAKEVVPSVSGTFVNLPGTN